MVRCTKCRFLLEAATPGLLPKCPQCGGDTVAVEQIEPTDAPPAPQTQKLHVVRVGNA
jgi:phage FluMu protein Com